MEDVGIILLEHIYSAKVAVDKSSDNVYPDIKKHYLCEFIQAH